MATSNFTVTLSVDQTPKEAFRAVNDIQGWWIEEIEGNSKKLDDEFAVRFADIHYSKQKLIEFIPDTKVVWLVTDSELSFLKDKSEWTGTKISFEIAKQNNKTQVRFTHHGLVPDIECYGACSNAWGDYIRNSLFSFITTGKGQPFRKEAEVKARQ